MIKMNNKIVKLLIGASLIGLSYFHPVGAKPFDWEKTYEDFSRGAQKKKEDLERKIDDTRREVDREIERKKKDLEESIDGSSRELYKKYESTKPLAEKTFRDASEGLKYLEENPRELYRVKEVYERIEAVNDGLMINAIKNIPVYDQNTGKLTSMDKAFRNVIYEMDSYHRLPEELKNDPVAFTYMLSTDPNIMLNSKIVPLPDGEYISVREASKRGLYSREIDSIVNDYYGMRRSYFDGDANKFSSHASNLTWNLKKIQDGDVQLYESGVLSALSKIPIIGGSTLVDEYLLGLYNNLKKEGVNGYTIDILLGTGLAILSFIGLAVGLKVIKGVAPKKRKNKIYEAEDKDTELGIGHISPIDDLVSQEPDRGQDGILDADGPAFESVICRDALFEEIDEESSGGDDEEAFEEPKHLDINKPELPDKYKDDLIGKQTNKRTATNFIPHILSVLLLGTLGFFGYYYNCIAPKYRSPAVSLDYGNGNYCVQVASFRESYKAEDLSNHLKKQDYKTYTIQRFVKGENWNGVRIGPFSTKEDAIRAKGIIISNLQEYDDAFVCKNK